MGEGQCLHTPCHCPSSESASYCSDSCYSADKDRPQSATCDCGHADCRTGEAGTEPAAAG